MISAVIDAYVEIGPAYGKPKLGKRVQAGLRQYDLEGCQMIDQTEMPISPEKLTRYRQSIDNIDAALVYMLAERFRITQAVGEFKAANTLPPADPEREKTQIARLRNLAQSANLDPNFTEKFLRFIIDEVIRHHEQIRKD